MFVALLVVHVAILGIVGANALYLRRHRRRQMPDAWPHVTVLIPARNEETNLRRLLPSLLAQQYDAFDVIVYDDGSEDGTWNVLQAFDDERLTALRGDGPPPGWVGKVHALYQATRHATGDLYLFLDADTELADPDALRRLVERHAALPERSVLTALPSLRGGGLLLVSQVPNAILSGLPWPLVPHLKNPALGALNGQCWMLRADLYRAYEPHEAVANEVLEDVMIGRHLKRQGVVPYMLDVTREVHVYMYRTFGEAWRGFRKNAYLILGGHPLPFVVFTSYFALVYAAAPLVAPILLLTVYAIKTATDRIAGLPLWVSALTPLTHVLSVVLQIDSAWHHWTGRVAWKGRLVGSS